MTCSCRRPSRRHAVLGLTAAFVAATLLWTPPPRVAAATAVRTPAGTKVVLQYIATFDTRDAHTGDKVPLKTGGATIVNDQIVIADAAGAGGTVTSVQQPGALMKQARAVIGSVYVTAVDHQRLAVSDIVVEPSKVEKRRRLLRSAARTALLGPVGLIVGAAVNKNGGVTVQRGSFVTQTTTESATVSVP